MRGRGRTDCPTPGSVTVARDVAGPRRAVDPTHRRVGNGQTGDERAPPPAKHPIRSRQIVMRKTDAGSSLPGDHSPAHLDIPGKRSSAGAVNPTTGRQVISGERVIRDVPRGVVATQCNCPAAVLRVRYKRRSRVVDHVLLPGT